MHPEPPKGDEGNLGVKVQPRPKGPTTREWGGIVHKILTLHHPRIYILYMGLLYLDWSVWLVFFFLLNKSFSSNRNAWDQC